MNTIVPAPLLLSLVAKFCPMPEALLTPAPLIVRVTPGIAETVKGLATAVKSTAPTSTEDLMVISVTFETLNVATSDGRCGTVSGVQLPGVFHTPVAGSRSQVALPPWLVFRHREYGIPPRGLALFGASAERTGRGS